METKYKKVGVEEFYSAIGNTDAVYTVIGDFPFQGEFRIRNTRKLVGMTSDSREGGRLIKSYYLPY